MQDLKHLLRLKGRILIQTARVAGLFRSYMVGVRIRNARFRTLIVGIVIAVRKHYPMRPEEREEK